MKKHFLVITCYFLLLFGCVQKQNETIIAFGSCSRETDSVQLWNHILTHQPSAWIWMGDNIYGDTYDMSVMRSKYERQKQRKSYQKLKNSIDVYGIWDDHDYGINDGGSEYSMRDQSKKLMLEFLDVPADAEVRQRSGAHQSHVIASHELKIKLILLDTRYFRDSLTINLDRPPLYHPNNNGTILGEEQWQWLKKELTNSKADIHLIGSSIQLIPNDHGYEKWGNFPNERGRFFDLIMEARPARPIILSGDRHIAEFSKIELKGLEYPLYEFTSSGLTHTWSNPSSEKNEFRIGDLMIDKNFGIIEILQHDKNIEIKFRVYNGDNNLIGETKATF